MNPLKLNSLVIHTETGDVGNLIEFTDPQDALIYWRDGSQSYASRSELFAV